MVIRVLLADDHPVVRQGLRLYLATRDGIEVVAEAADGAAAVRKARAADPDVVVMDLLMPGLAGVDAIRALQDAGVRARVLVLTSFASEDQVLPALRAGAAGYLLKDAEPGTVEAAIRTVAEGGTVLDPGIAAVVRAELAAPASGRGADALTPREHEVLRELAHGRSNREIARALVITEKTVKTHVSSILAKLGVADRTQAALRAVREGLVDPAG